jgi:hypothetical protein
MPQGYQCDKILMAIKDYKMPSSSNVKEFCPTKFSISPLKMCKRYLMDSLQYTTTTACDKLKSTFGAKLDLFYGAKSASFLVVQFVQCLVPTQTLKFNIHGRMDGPS